MTMEQGDRPPDPQLPTDVSSFLEDLRKAGISAPLMVLARITGDSSLLASRSIAVNLDGRHNQPGMNLLSPNAPIPSSQTIGQPPKTVASQRGIGGAVDSILPVISYKIVETHRGEPCITFEDNEIQQMNKIKNIMLVGKFSHGKPLLSEIRSYFAKTFVLRGTLEIGLMDPRNVFLAFSNPDDCVDILATVLTVFPVAQHTKALAAKRTLRTRSASEQSNVAGFYQEALDDDSDSSMVGRVATLNLRGTP
nr:TMV resistance protein N-like [Ipomoea batatas]